MEKKEGLYNLVTITRYIHNYEGDLIGEEKSYYYIEDDQIEFIKDICDRNSVCDPLH